MAVQYIWYWPVRPYSGTSDSGPVNVSWSMDVSIASPSSGLEVYAVTAMQTVSIEQGGYAFSGISSYTKSGVPQPVGTSQPFGVVPAIFDGPVDTVTFGWGLGAVAGLSTSADITFQIFGFG